MSTRLHDPQISASKIKKARKDKEMTQKDLSQKSGLHIQTIKQYECGKRVPDEYGRACLAQALNMPPLWFVGGHIAKEMQNED